MVHCVASRYPLVESSLEGGGARGLVPHRVKSPQATHLAQLSGGHEVLLRVEHKRHYQVEEVVHDRRMRPRREAVRHELQERLVWEACAVLELHKLRVRFPADDGLAWQPTPEKLQCTHENALVRLPDNLLRNLLLHGHSPVKHAVEKGLEVHIVVRRPEGQHEHRRLRALLLDLGRDEVHKVLDVFPLESDVVLLFKQILLICLPFVRAFELPQRLRRHVRAVYERLLRHVFPIHRHRVRDNKRRYRRQRFFRSRHPTR